MTCRLRPAVGTSAAPTPSDIRWLFIHGLGHSGQTWMGVTERLSGEAWVVDLAGHGGAPWRPDGYTALGHAEDVSAALSTAPPGRWMLVGHSLGADIAIRLSRMAESRVRGLVLVDYNPAPQPSAVSRMCSDLRAGLGQGFASFTTYLADRGLQAPLADPDLLRRVAAQEARLDPDGRYRAPCDPRVLDFDPEAERDGEAEAWTRISAVTCPTLLIRGAGSAFLPAGAARRILDQGIVQARLETVPRAGHGVMLDNPANLAEKIYRFAETLARP